MIRIFIYLFLNEKKTLHTLVSSPIRSQTVRLAACLLTLSEWSTSPVVGWTAWTITPLAPPAPFIVVAVLISLSRGQRLVQEGPGQLSLPMDLQGPPRSHSNVFPPEVAMLRFCVVSPADRRSAEKTMNATAQDRVRIHGVTCDPPYLPYRDMVRFPL